ncbi:DUF1877 family protein [Streptomyces sp. NPDC127092]|uniref:DUF1877 family protein n=1 Tax=Streptomyces sp. NPDC127092 TaxID=3347135 RepID=UPI00365CC533
MHLHLRAAAETDIRDDYAWLTAFMGVAWDHHEVEYAAGIAHSIEKDYRLLHEMYAECQDADAWLPVFGGRQPADPPAGGLPHPPLMLMDPAEAGRAAAFLAAVPFDDLWSRAGARILSSFGPGWSADPDRIRRIFQGHHQDLRAFYARAAAAGHAVVKAGWF